ncbi:NADH:ubiquinone oxidoreductase [Desulfosediminicola sp.]|uniref:NADH-quinone oxidoreductase subunit B family protein n=1 Tax=Desulfosediminicola sp. TaxID=2886825 RepID=UPI003AF3149B
MQKGLSYLGRNLPRPRVAFFEFTSCEGCQLQLLNDEHNLLDFLNLLEIVTFREAMTSASDQYDIAFVEGSISCSEEVAQLQEIRTRAATLVALGSCACFGGINQLRNRFSDSDWPSRLVYGDSTIPMTPLPKVLPLHALVEVDLQIFGCPIHKGEVERIVTNLVVGKKISHPNYPVCMECTAAGHICLFEHGEACLGPVTRAGCNAWCPAERSGCQGCRGPAEVANLEELEQIFQQRGIPLEVMLDYLECHGGFPEWSARLRQKLATATTQHTS